MEFCPGITNNIIFRKLKMRLKMQSSVVTLMIGDVFTSVIWSIVPDPEFLTATLLQNGFCLAVKYTPRSGIFLCIFKMVVLTVAMGRRKVLHLPFKTGNEQSPQQ